MDKVSILVLMGVWATVLMFIMMLSEHLEKIIEPSFKKEIISMLTKFPYMHYSDIARKSNQIFFKLFDHLYFKEYFSISNYRLWGWIIHSYLLIIFIGLSFIIFQVTAPPLTEIILCSITLTTFIYILVPLNKYFIKNPSWMGNFKYLIPLFSFLCCIFFAFIYINFFQEIFNIPRLILILVVLFIPDFFIYFSNPKTKIIFRISPIRVIISSIIIMFFITFIKIDVVSSFKLDFNQFGMIIFVYIFLNILADSISLWETSFVLRWTSTGTIYKFFTFFLFDILISAFIFLAIPFSTNNLPTFLDGIIFQGDHPWLGILFWSTFSTSVIFWIFLMTIGVLIVLQRILRIYNKLDIFLSITRKPIHCLGLVSMVPLTIILIIWILIF